MHPMMPAAMNPAVHAGQQPQAPAPKRKQHCSFCKNHDIRQRKNGHTCKYKNCPCLLCRLSTKAQIAMRKQQALWRHQNRMLAKDERFQALGLTSRQLCDKCRNHNEFFKKRGHKTECKFETCSCPLCDLTDKRRLIMKYQQRVRRANLTSREMTDSEDEDNDDQPDDHPDDPPDRNSDESAIVSALDAVTKAIDNLPDIDIKTRYSAKMPKKNSKPTISQTGMTAQSLQRPMSSGDEYSKHESVQPRHHPMLGSFTHSPIRKYSPPGQGVYGMDQDRKMFYDSKNMIPSHSQRLTPTADESTVTVKKEIQDDDIWHQSPPQGLKQKAADISSVASSIGFPYTPQMYLDGVPTSYSMSVNPPALRHATQLSLSSIHQSTLETAAGRSTSTEKCSIECNRSLLSGHLSAYNLSHHGGDTKDPQPNLGLLRQDPPEEVTSALGCYANSMYQRNPFLSRTLPNTNLDRENTFGLPRATSHSALEELTLFSKIAFQHQQRRMPEHVNNRDENSPFHTLNASQSHLHRPSLLSNDPASGSHSSIQQAPIHPSPVRLLPSDLRWPSPFLWSQFPMMHSEALLHPYPHMFLPTNRAH